MHWISFAVCHFQTYLTRKCRTCRTVSAKCQHDFIPKSKLSLLPHKCFCGSTIWLYFRQLDSKPPKNMGCTNCLRRGPSPTFMSICGLTPNTCCHRSNNGCHDNNLFQLSLDQILRESECIFLFDRCGWKWMKKLRNSLKVRFWLILYWAWHHK